MFKQLLNLLSQVTAKKQVDQPKEGTVETMFCSYRYRQTMSPDQEKVTFLAPTNTEVPFAYAAQMIGGWPTEKELKISVDSFLQGYMKGIGDHYSACEIWERNISPPDYKDLYAKSVVVKVAGDM